MKRKPKSYEDDYWPESNILGVGSYCIWREDSKKKTPDKKIVGFVRDKQVQRTKKK